VDEKPRVAIASSLALIAGIAIFGLRSWRILAGGRGPSQYLYDALGVLGLAFFLGKGIVWLVRSR
jgi:hypothetical protein